MIATILNALQLLLIVVTPFVVFTLIIHRIERFTQHRLATRFGWKSILWTGWLGTPVHELSHVAMCIVFRHRIDDVALFEPDLQSGRLGYVRHSFTKSNWFERLGNVFIGLAPLAGGAIALAILLVMFYPAAVQNAIDHQRVTLIHDHPGGQPTQPLPPSNPPSNPLSAPPLDPTFATPINSATPISPGVHFNANPNLNANQSTGVGRPTTMGDSITNFFNATATATGTLFDQIFNRDNVQTKRFWCFLYLTLCVGSHMAPSRSDYAGARHGAMLFGGIIAAIVLTVSVLGMDSVAASIWILNLISPILAVMTLAVILCSIAAALVYAITMPFAVRYEIR